MRIIQPWAQAIVAITLDMVAQRAAIAIERKPKSFGAFSTWTAAIYVCDGDLTCYAFVRSASSAALVRKSKTPTSTTFSLQGSKVTSNASAKACSA